ncbi:MAG: DUF3332 domain-containing protein [Bacteroidetes bacterium]|nr:DUF3332 domain-containing protein [Bacteroidota bacterium]
MNRYLKVISLCLAVVVGSTSLASCYGKFALTRKLYTWNGTLGNKFVNTLVMWVLWIVPVYGIAGLIDIVALNTIEFWTGSNPMAMKEGQVEKQKVAYEGTTYELTATRNKLEIVALDGASAGIKTSLQYNEEDQSWYANHDGMMEKIAQIHPEDGTYELINPAEAR